MSERRVVVFGGRGTAVNIAEQIEDARNRFGHAMRVEGFAIDDPALGNEIGGFPIVSGVRQAWTKYRYTDVEFLFALYRPDLMAARLALLRELQIPVLRFANFVHPSVYMSATASIGRGNVVLSNSSLQHGVTLGNFNIINSNVVVEHDTSFKDGAFVAASVCVGARVQVGTGAFIGLNATVREDVVLADYAFVGLASGVVRSVGSGDLVYGVPAKQKK